MWIGPREGQKELPAGRGLLNKRICCKTVLLLVLSPQKLGARDLGFYYLGSSMRTDKHVVWIDRNVKDAIRRPKRSGCIRRWSARRNHRFGDCHLQPRGSGPAPGAYTSTPALGLSPRFGPQNGTRPKLFGLDLPTPVPGKPPPPPRPQPKADFSNLQPNDLTTSLMDTVAPLQSEVYALKFAPSVPLTPTPWIHPAQPRRPRLRLQKSLAAFDLP